jgi:hypothetical protein
MCEWVHIWSDIDGGQNMERLLEHFNGLKMRVFNQIFKISKVKLYLFLR